MGDITRQVFIDAIDKDPLDMTTRKIFSDWLDEHDEPELADFHRSMTAEKYISAKGLMDEFTDELGITFERLVELATNALNEGDDRLCLDFDTPDMVYSQREDFWQAFHVVTGISVPDDYDVRLPISCAC